MYVENGENPVEFFFSGILNVHSKESMARYIGCFKDSRHQRILNGLSKPLTSSSMTVALCTNYCTEHEFRFAGLQFRYEISVLIKSKANK